MHRTNGLEEALRFLWVSRWVAMLLWLGSRDGVRPLVWRSRLLGNLFLKVGSRKVNSKINHPSMFKAS